MSMHDEPLRRLLPLSPAEVAGVAAAVATRLAELHASGDVHGNVTLDTILVGPGRVELLDGVTRAGGKPADDVAALGRVVTAALAAWPLGAAGVAPGETAALAGVAAEARRAAVVGAPSAGELVGRFASAVHGARLPRARILPAERRPAPAHLARESLAPLGSVAFLVTWIAALVTTIAVLTGLGGDLAAPPVFAGPAQCGEWLAARPPETVVAALLRVAVLALAWFLLATTVLDAVLRAAHATSRAAALVDAITVPSIRRLVHGAVGVSVAAGAMVATTDVAPVTTSATRVTVAGSTATTTISTTTPTTTTTSTPPSTPAVVSATPTPTPPRDNAWIVAPGEHLWAIAERTVSDAWQRPPSDAEMVPYWLTLVEANRDRLVDPANPDLVFAGQTMFVPPPPPPPHAGAR